MNRTFPPGLFAGDGLKRFDQPHVGGLLSHLRKELAEQKLVVPTPPAPSLDAILFDRAVMVFSVGVDPFLKAAARAGDELAMAVEAVKEVEVRDCSPCVDHARPTGFCKSHPRPACDAAVTVTSHPITCWPCMSASRVHNRRALHGITDA